MGLGRENENFIRSAVPDDLLDQAAEYIAKNVDPMLVYDEDELKELVAQLMTVEEFVDLKRRLEG